MYREVRCDVAYGALLTSGRRLAGALVWSLAMRSTLAREAEVRTLARRLSGQAGTGLATFARRPKGVARALAVWHRPTLPGTIRALALALAARQIRPRLAAHA